jgi:hypothetical protein
MSDWKRAESSTCKGETGIPPEWLGVLAGATPPLVGKHRLSPEREAAREGCARVALARRLLGRPATALPNVSRCSLRAPVVGVAAVALVGGCCAAGRLLLAPFRAVVVPPPSPAHGKRDKTGSRRTPATRATGLRRPLLKDKDTERVCRDPLPALPFFPCVLASPGPGHR